VVRSISHRCPPGELGRLMVRLPGPDATFAVTVERDTPFCATGRFGSRFSSRSTVAERVAEAPPGAAAPPGASTGSRLHNGEMVQQDGALIWRGRRRGRDR
jgi:hypothetical protein